MIYGALYFWSGSLQYFPLALFHNGADKFSAVLPLPVILLPWRRNINHSWCLSSPLLSQKKASDRQPSAASTAPVRCGDDSGNGKLMEREINSIFGLEIILTDITPLVGVQYPTFIFKLYFLFFHFPSLKLCMWCEAVFAFVFVFFSLGGDGLNPAHWNMASVFAEYH